MTRSPLLGRAGTDTVHLMSYNLRYPADDPGHLWADRRPAMASLLNVEQPTVLGTQEGMDGQLGDVADDLPDRYEWIGTGREGGSDGEFAAIFFDTERLRPIHHAHFWLSDRPHSIGSMTWGNTIPRMATWVRFLDVTSSREFVVLNTHFDHRNEHARERSAELVASTVANFDVPTVVMGDFNTAAEASRPYRLLTEGTTLMDTWQHAKRRVTSDYGTYCGYRSPAIGGIRIDWILTTPEFEVEAAAINPTTIDGRFPSDHLPVQAHVRLR
jgi:endonuclease/exonuclease/phosphatase family metal-dependent hydrolase